MRVLLISKFFHLIITCAHCSTVQPGLLGLSSLELCFGLVVDPFGLAFGQILQELMAAAHPTWAGPNLRLVSIAKGVHGRRLVGCIQVGKHLLILNLLLLPMVKMIVVVAVHH